jgi:RNA polymerase sigma factor (sigma-70 family)
VTLRSGWGVDRLEGLDRDPGDEMSRVLATQRTTEADSECAGNQKTTLSPDDADLVLVVARARDGEAVAWETLITRFGGLVAAIARQCRLSDADIAEVCQTTWLRLVENLDRIEQPERLGAWLATTSRRESLRIATQRVVVSANDFVHLVVDEKADPLDAALLRQEQEHAIRLAAERLSPRCQRLLGLLMGNDDLPYKQIAEQLHMPIGSIGPTRGRCLDHLREILSEMEAPDRG